MRHVLALVLVMGCGGPQDPPQAADAAPDVAAADMENGGDEGDVHGIDPAVLTLSLPAHPRPMVAFPVVVSTLLGSPFTGDVVLAVNGADVATARVIRGRGSALLMLDDLGQVLVEARAPGWAGSTTAWVEDRAEIEVSGILAQGAGPWTSVADVLVTADLQVEGDLWIGPGTRILVGPGVNIEVTGSVTVEGTADDPVLMAPLGPGPWGGIRFSAPGVHELAHVLVTGGGGDGSKAFGHSASQAVLHVDGCTLRMDGGAIADNPGKALAGEQATIELDDLLITRCDTGGELDSTVLTMRRSHVLEIPDGDGVAEDDDNDGIYLVGAAMDAGGVPITSIIEDSVFAVGEDDGIDQNDALVAVRRTWIEGFAHEGIAASNGHGVQVVDSVIRGCGQGIEAGYGAPAVTVDHCLVTGNEVGLRYGDDYDWEVTGTLVVTATVATGNQTNVMNHVNVLGGPHPDGLWITCSMVDDDAYDGLDSNVAGSPIWTEDGCVDAAPMTGPLCDGDIPGPTCADDPGSSG